MKGVRWNLFAKFAVALTSLFAIFVISLVNTNSVFAQEKTNVGGTRINSINYQINGQDFSVTLKDNTYFPVSLDVVPAQSTFQVGALKVNFFNSNPSIKKGRHFSFSYQVTFLVARDYPFPSGSNPTAVSSDLYPSALCPSGRNGWVVDGCSIDQVDSNSSLVNTYYSNGTYRFNNAVYYTYNISLEGHFSYDTQNRSNAEFAGIWLTTYNSASIDGYLGTGIAFSTFYLFDYVDGPEEEMNKKDNQDRSNMESQQSSVDSDSGSSQSDASSQGTTLLAAFTAFVGALTSSNPTDCSINMDMGNLNLGNVDLCQLDLPPAFQALASIMLIGFCVPLSMATARKVISLFRSFQG